MAKKTKTKSGASGRAGLFIQRAGGVERATGRRIHAMAGASDQLAEGRGRRVAGDGETAAGRASIPFPRGWRMARRPGMHAARAESVRRRKHDAAGGVKPVVPACASTRRAGLIRCRRERFDHRTFGRAAGDKPAARRQQSGPATDRRLGRHRESERPGGTGIAKIDGGRRRGAGRGGPMDSDQQRPRGGGRGRIEGGVEPAHPRAARRGPHQLRQLSPAPSGFGARLSGLRQFSG